MAFRSVRKFVLFIAMTLVVGLLGAAQASDPVIEVENAVAALGGRVVYGDANVDYAIVEVVLTGAATRVTPEALASLAKPLAALPHFRRLTVVSGHIRDEDLRIFIAIPQLEDLQLNCHLTGAGVAHLAGLRNLTSLGFFCSEELTDTALIQMKSMTQLKRIRLVATSRVTDTGLKLLRDLPALEELTLRYTGVTAEGLDVLEGFTALRRLSLVGSSRTPISRERIRELRVALPGCEITEK